MISMIPIPLNVPYPRNVNLSPLGSSIHSLQTVHRDNFGLHDLHVFILVLRILQAKATEKHSEDECHPHVIHTVSFTVLVFLLSGTQGYQWLSMVYLHKSQKAYK